MIKIDLITGFLGSGKTTFLLKYARYLMSKGLKIGILEYDYGAVNVDMLLLNKLRGKQCELEMVAAACDEDCLRRRFTTKLISMAMSGYDRVIIEPSGVFDMDMFFDALREDPLEKWYEIGSVISIVNANLTEDMTEEEDYFLASQAAGSGCVLFSRAQLSTPEKIQSVVEHIERAEDKINCNRYKGKYIAKDWSQFEDSDYEELIDCGYQINDYIKHIAGSELGFSSVYILDSPDDLETIKGKIDTLLSKEEYGKVIRVKGFVCEDGGSVQINASQYELMIEPISIGQGVLIVIGTDLKEKEIKKLFNV